MYLRTLALSVQMLCTRQTTIFVEQAGTAKLDMHFFTTKKSEKSQKSERKIKIFKTTRRKSSFLQQ